MIARDHPRLSLSRQYRLVPISRSSLCYTPRGESEATLALMRRIDELYLKHPFYGSRQMVRHLRREGVRVGRHRMRRLMRLMGLQAIYQAPKTSAGHPEHRVYPYLLKELSIPRPNHVWCADITPAFRRGRLCIPVRRGFFYLVAIMDWATRRVLAWRLSNTMDVDFCVAALKEALARFGTPEVFSTDQGSQFTSRTFTSVLEDAGVRISMDGGAVHGQHLHRAAVAVAEIRGGLPARAWRRLRGPAGHRRVDGFLQCGATAYGAERPDAVRGLCDGIACGHDGQACRLAHLPTGATATTVDRRGIGGMISNRNTP